MSMIDYIWLCPQCNTSYSDEVAADQHFFCADHPDRKLVKHHGMRHIWKCGTCGLPHSSDEVRIYKGACRIHRETPLMQWTVPSKYENDERRDTDFIESPWVAPTGSPAAAVETEEGEYDFGFGRPAPSAPKVSTRPLRDLEVEPVWLTDDFKRPSVDETSVMARTIRVLADKMGGKVPLSPTELNYILFADDRPVPNIVREVDSPMGGRLWLRIEYDK